MKNEGISMRFYRDEILPNVYLTALKTDKFKTLQFGESCRFYYG